MPADGGVTVEAGFEQGGLGRLFCVRAKPTARPADAAALFVHAFGEEMNKSRHVVAAVARTLAANGILVEIPDLHGCGDSEGMLEDATVEGWLGDIVARASALAARVDGGTVHLWGMRLGALLAAAAAQRLEGGEGSLMLWQPVLRGRQALTEFLRLRAAAGLFAGDGPRETADGLKARLEAGESLEIAGYVLSPQLAAGLDALVLRDTSPAGRRVHWFEVARDPQRPLSPAAKAVIDGWKGHGAEVAAQTVAGPVFWSAAELEDCPALAPATLAALCAEPR